jgi:hypothetical protein
MKQFLAGLCAVCMLLTGCASTQQIGDADRASLASVRVNSNVETAPQMYYMGPASGIGFMFGAVGGLVTALANQSPGEQFRKFAEEHGITIDRIVREEAIKALQGTGKLKLTEASGPEVATLNIKVQMYGFTIPNGFSGSLVPVVGIQCSLVDTQGKTIWSSRDSVGPLGSPAEGKTPDEYHANPALIEDAWRLAAHKVMADIVRTL